MSSGCRMIWPWLFLMLLHIKFGALWRQSEMTKINNCCIQDKHVQVDAEENIRRDLCRERAEINQTIKTHQIFRNYWMQRCSLKTTL